MGGRLQFIYSHARTQQVKRPLAATISGHGSTNKSLLTHTTARDGLDPVTLGANSTTAPSSCEP